MDLRNEYAIDPIYLVSGDTLTMTIEDMEHGQLVREVENIGQSLTVDCIRTYNVSAEHGFEHGIAVLFGKKEN